MVHGGTHRRGSVKLGSLCSGYGGLDMATLDAFPDAMLAWHCEIDPDASMVLKYHSPHVPNHGDLKIVDWSTVEPVDILAMGVPCQPVSSAGRQRGDADERWLLPYALIAIRSLAPQWIVFENVRNLISTRKGELWRGILDDLRAAGYAVRWLTLGACAVGMPHHRHRVFALAERAGVDAPEAIRLHVPECGMPRGDKDRGLLLTPRACDGDGRTGPTTMRSDGYGPAGLASQLALLPTPTARDGDGRDKGVPLGAALRLLPSPRATDGVNGGPGQRGSKGDLAMPSAVQPERWGQYADAVTRWSTVFGTPPAPTEPNRNGSPRLAAPFVEWMMGIPAGHVTAVATNRNAALRIIGNGVAPPQGTRALALLRSGDITASTTDWGTMADEAVMKEIKERAESRARRVLDATMSLGITVNQGVLADALEELAACFRAEAELHANSKKRGWQSTATELRQTAARVAGVAVDMRALVIDNEPPTAPASGDLVVMVVGDEMRSGVVQPDGSYDLGSYGKSDVQDYLAGVRDSPTPEQTEKEPASVSGSTLADEVKADQMTNPTVAPAFVTPGAYAPAPIALGPRWTFEQLMRDPNPASTPPSHWSWSQLETIEDCGLKYRFQRVEQLPQVPQWALVGGNTFHACVEQIESGLIPDQPSDLGALWNHWLHTEIAETAKSTTLPPDRWRASNKGAEGYTWWREAGPDMLKRYVEWRSTARVFDSPLKTLLTITGTPVIEYKCTLTLPGDIEVKCVIDAAYVLEDGSVLIVDYKSGKSTGDISQLGLYAHALADQLGGEYNGFGPKRIYGTIYDARKGESSAAVNLLAEHPLSEYIYRVHTAEATRRAGLYRPRKSPFCNGCAVQYACPLFAGKDS